MLAVGQDPREHVESPRRALWVRLCPNVARERQALAQRNEIGAVSLENSAFTEVDFVVERNVIELSARRQPLRQAGDEVIIDERPQGEFRRQLFLGDNLDPDKLTAVQQEGTQILPGLGLDTGKLRN